MNSNSNAANLADRRLCRVELPGNTAIQVKEIVGDAIDSVIETYEVRLRDAHEAADRYCDRTHNAHVQDRREEQTRVEKSIQILKQKNDGLRTSVKDTRKAMKNFLKSHLKEPVCQSLWRVMQDYDIPAEFKPNGPLSLGNNEDTFLNAFIKGYVDVAVIKKETTEYRQRLKRQRDEANAPPVAPVNAPPVAPVDPLADEGGETDSDGQGQEDESNSVYV